MARIKRKPDPRHSRIFQDSPLPEDGPTNDSLAVNSEATKSSTPQGDQSPEITVPETDTSTQTGPEADRPERKLSIPLGTWTIEVFKTQADGSVKVYQYGRLLRIEPPDALPQRALWYTRQIMMLREQERRRKRSEEGKEKVREDEEEEDRKADGKEAVAENPEEQRRGTKRGREENVEKVKEGTTKRRKR